MPTDDLRLAEIRQRSAELWRLAGLPKGAIDPKTGQEAAWVIPKRADEEVRFLLTQIDALQDDASRLEDLVERVCIPTWRDDDAE